MKIQLKATGQYSADVFVNDKRFGTASDCDLGRWIISKNMTAAEQKADDKLREDDLEAWLDSEQHPLVGCYPAKTLTDLAFAIRECVDGANLVSIIPA